MIKFDEKKEKTMSMNNDGEMGNKIVDLNYFFYLKRSNKRIIHVHNDW